MNKYELLDNADEQRVELEGTLPYEILVHIENGEKRISLPGLRNFILEKTEQKKVQIHASIESISLDKCDTKDANKWVWRSIVSSKNCITGNETFGVADALYNKRSGEQDRHGRAKATNLAERNANYKQFTHEEIRKYVNSVKPENIVDITKNGGSVQRDKKSAPASKPVQTTPTEKQTDYLKNLKWTEMIPKTKNEASVLIAEIEKTNLKTVLNDDKWSHLQHKPTKKQIYYLKDLRWTDLTPKTSREMSLLIEAINKTKLETVLNDKKWSHLQHKPTKKQIYYLKDLKWTDLTPKTSREMSLLIEAINKTKLKKVVEDKKWSHLLMTNHKITAEQTETLKKLGHANAVPTSMSGASILIDNLKKEQSKSKSGQQVAKKSV